MACSLDSNIASKTIMSRPSLLQRRWMNRATDESDDHDTAADDSATARAAPQVEYRPAWKHETF